MFTVVKLKPGSYNILLYILPFPELYPDMTL